MKVKALVDSGCTHTGIDEQLVKNKRIQTKPINFSFEVFNANGIKNREVTKVAPLETEINEHKETLEAAVTDLDGTDMFLGHDWLVKHNPEVNWKNGTIKFTRCPGNCTMKHEDIQFKSRRTKTTEIIDNKEQNNRKIGKELDKMNPEDLPEYIRPFTHLFNKKKFKNLPERHEWDHEINLMDEPPKELNAKACYNKGQDATSSNWRSNRQTQRGVVATTCWNGTCSMLTSAKLTEGYLVVGITRELDKEPSLHCSSIYINYIWSVLQQYLLALMSMPLPHVLLLKATMPYTYALMSYSLISIMHMCTMCTP